MVSAQVMTVLGPVPADQLGITLPHEHLLIDMHRVTRIGDHLLNDVSLAIKEVSAFRQAGGSSLVDVTNRNLGRDPAALQRIARETGLNIVMGCGWYTEPYYDRDLHYQSVNQIADGILRDIVEGVDDTGVRAGIIGEIGCDLYHVSPVEERVLRAAARAQKQTGLAITTHAVRCPAGLWQLDILEEEGVDLRRAIVGHCDLYPRPEYHEAIARRGAYVAFDTIRGLNLWDVQCRIEWLKLLLEKGYLRQILISQDVCMKSYTKNYGGQGYDYILTRLVPMLRESGLSQEQIHVLTVENPRTALIGVAP